MKGFFLSLLGVAVFIIFAGLLIRNLQKKTPETALPKFQKSQIKINGIDIEVEIASTSEQRKMGLSKREGLYAYSGMLFKFEQNDVIPSFWMKDMKFAIDILWINDGKIIKVDEKVPPPTDGTPDEKLKIFNPGKPVDYVLELNSGFCERNSIKVGDAIEINLENI